MTTTLRLNFPQPPATSRRLPRWTRHGNCIDRSNSAKLAAIRAIVVPWHAISALGCGRGGVGLAVPLCHRPGHGAFFLQKNTTDDLPSVKNCRP